MLYSSDFKSPLGNLSIQCSEVGLQKVAFCPKPVQNIDNWFISETKAYLNGYFDGQFNLKRPQFDLKGKTFSLEIWHYLQEIPCGETTTYSKIASKFGGVSYSRAVASAIANNPIPIIIPCHRVIGSNGNLTGYLGGLPNKKWLLEHERAIQSHQQTLFQ